MGEWRTIESAPRGDEESGPFFDVMWKGDITRYGHVRRVINCYREGDVVKVKHGYPAVWTIFRPQPTHWTPAPPAGEDAR